MDSLFRPRARKHDLALSQVKDAWKQAKKETAKKGYKVGSSKFYRETFKLLDKKVAQLKRHMPQNPTQPIHPTQQPERPAVEEKKELDAKPKGQ